MTDVETDTAHVDTVELPGVTIRGPIENGRVTWAIEIEWDDGEIWKYVFVRFPDAVLCKMAAIKALGRHLKASVAV